MKFKKDSKRCAWRDWPIEAREAIRQARRELYRGHPWALMLEANLHTKDGSISYVWKVGKWGQPNCDVREIGKEA